MQACRNNFSPDFQLFVPDCPKGNLLGMAWTRRRVGMQQSFHCLESSRVEGWSAWSILGLDELFFLLARLQHTAALIDGRKF